MLILYPDPPTGDVTLVLALHVARVPMDSPVPLARFSSGGPMGTTPWEKDVCVMPSETAAVAGHTRCSEILRLVEAGVPFFWR